MSAFHLFIRFVLLVGLPIGMLVMMNDHVEDIRSVDIKSDGQNREPVFSPANRDWLAASQDYFLNNDDLLLFSNGLSSNSGLDEDESKWYIYTDGEGIPTSAVNNVSNPSLDGHSLRCAITGGDPYSNVHCYRNLPAEPTSNFFTLSLSFYYQPASSFNNVGGDSIVQGLEFTMNKWDQGLRYEWALQWDNVDNGAPKWRYWDPAHSPRWVDLGISGSIAGEQWHTLTLEGEILEGKVRYRRFVFDQHEYQLNNILLVATASTPNEFDRLAVAVQLDGNSVETPYELFIDHVTLTSIDSIGPTISSILRANSNLTDLASVDFTVTFSEPVTGVDAADFTVTTTGVSGTAVSGVSGTGSVYTVTVNTGSGNGTIRLDVLADNTIVDAALNPLGAGFTNGETYIVLKTTPLPTTLVNSVLPTSRTVPVGTMATIFNTVINAGLETAYGVTLSMSPTPVGTFVYQQTDCATNAIIGTPNPSLVLAPGGVLCYVLSFTPSATFSATSVHIQAQAINGPSTNLLTGINTWLLRATDTLGPDIIALTTTTDFHQVSCSGANAFAVALSNVGAAATGDITVTANTGSATLPLSISISETDPATGAVIGDHILQSVGAGENRTVAVFVTFNGCISFDPAVNRIFIEFRDAGNNVVGSTSTAVSTGR